jgi:ABC-type branched-subunit amino acid transport system substrate-binding protein
MVDAAQLALFERGDARLELLPRDTKGTPGGARLAAESAFRSGARIVLGPLFATEAAAVKPLARTNGAKMITFTNDDRLADADTFTFGLGPAQQIERVIRYALTHNMRRFAVLTPQSPYGDAIATAANSAVSRGGGVVVRAERYPPNEVEVNAAVRRLLGSGTIERLAPGGLGLQPEEGITNIDFDALIVAEGGDGMKTLLRLLTAAGLQPHRVKLIGTERWDEPGLSGEAGLVGGWFAAPSPVGRQAFETSFQRAFGQTPPRLATLAYDATSVVGETLRRQSLEGPQITLTDPRGTTGADGIVRLRPDGMVERGLAVMEITPSGPMVIDPAPITFPPPQPSSSQPLTH